MNSTWEAFRYIFHSFNQRNFTTHPMRLTKTFYAEFTNWNAVYEAIQMRLHNVAFINEIFALLARVIDHIKMNEVNVANSLRSLSHKSIEFAQNLDRSHVTVYANIIYTLLHADRQLRLIEDVSFYRISLLHFCCGVHEKGFFSWFRHTVMCSKDSYQKSQQITFATHLNIS